ncbi:MAG: hypothetical protein MZV64_16680 [Ignavibacteriales bacterium]|nr:hypothetical protein [Ignavibacteriales bacterium]
MRRRTPCSEVRVTRDYVLGLQAGPPAPARSWGRARASRGTPPGTT